jgi:hypothetical protein
MRDVKGQRVETPLLRRHSMVGPAKADTRAGDGPMGRSMMCYVKGRASGNTVSDEGRWAGKIIGLDWCIGWCRDG